MAICAARVYVASLLNDVVLKLVGILHLPSCNKPHVTGVRPYSSESTQASQCIPVSSSKLLPTTYKTLCAAVSKFCARAVAFLQLTTTRLAIILRVLGLQP